MRENQRPAGGGAGVRWTVWTVAALMLLVGCRTASRRAPSRAPSEREETASAEGGRPGQAPDRAARSDKRAAERTEPAVPVTPNRAGGMRIFPQPVKLEILGGVMPVDRAARIVLASGDEGLKWVADVLSRELGRALGAEGGRLAVVADDGLRAGAAGDIILEAAASDEVPTKAGAYVVDVTPGAATISGRDARGAYHGALTLLQLFGSSGPGRGTIACAKVIDHPYHFYRGMRASFPRGKPRAGEISHAYFKDLLRLISLFKLNHVWVEGTSWSIPQRRHPEVAWANVLTFEQAKAFDRFGTRHFLSMDGSLHWAWVYYDYKHLAELHPDETWENMRGVKKRSRVNVCPSKPETWKMLFETMEDIMEILSGDHFAVPLDEMYQEYHGSRWAACSLCRGKDPVQLYADFASRLTAHVIERGKTPIMSGGMLLRAHQGHYKGIYKAVDLIENRDKIVIYNWSEGHIRRGAMARAWKDPTLRIPDFRATPFFREHGYKDVMHMFAGNNQWRGRPEMREVRGRLDCYGGFVSYYHPMNYEAMKEKGTVANLAFTAQHLWSPDLPPMDSAEDAEACSYAETLADAVLRGRSFVEAVSLARAALSAPSETTTSRAAAATKGTPKGRVFESGDPAVNLMGRARGGRTEGRMRIVLPIEEANPEEAHLVLTIHDWDQAGEGEIYLNQRKVDLKTSKLSNGRDHEFPPVRVPASWLKFGQEPNVLRFVWRSTSGFVVKKAEICLSERRR